MNFDTITQSYRQRLQRQTLALAATLALTLIVAVYAVTRGAYTLSPFQILRALLFESAGERADVVIRRSPTFIFPWKRAGFSAFSASTAPANPRC